MTRQKYIYDFFLAHAGADTETAEELFDLLTLSSKTFLDSRSLLPGDNWDEGLSEAQNKSLITVVIISPKSDSAYFEREEIATAIDMARKGINNHRVVPLYLDISGSMLETRLYGLRRKHALFLSKSSGLSEIAQRLLDLLANIKKTRPTSSARIAAITGTGEKARLIAAMGSVDNVTAVNAVNQLRSRGWLMDGSLAGAFLAGANLKGAYLSEADLERCDLQGVVLHGAKLNGVNLACTKLSDANLEEAELIDANLKGATLQRTVLRGARVSIDQLIQAHSMRFTIMPDNTKYSGYLNLHGDLEIAHKDNVEIGDMTAMAAWHGVSKKQYLLDHNWGAHIRKRESVKVQAGELLVISDTYGTAVLEFFNAIHDKAEYRWRYYAIIDEREKIGSGICFRTQDSAHELTFIRMGDFLVNWSMAKRSMNESSEEWVYYNSNTTRVKILRNANFKEMDLRKLHFTE